MLPRAALLLTVLLTATCSVPSTDASGCLEACELRLEAEQCADEVELCFDLCADDIDCMKACILNDLIACIAEEAEEGADELVECAAGCVGEVEEAFDEAF